LTFNAHYIQTVIMQIKTNHTTHAYRFTIDPINKDDQRILKELRAHISESNKKGEIKRRVELKGRLGKNHPKKLKYSNYGSHRVKFEDSQWIDVYIYNH